MTLARFLISIYLAAPFGRVFIHGDNNADSTDGKLTLVFSSVTPASWKASNLTQVFQAALSTVTNGYCARSTTTCSLKTWDGTKTFGPGNVVIVQGFPQSNGADLNVKFYVTYPTGVDFSGDSTTVLAATTVKEIVLDKKENISKAVGRSIKSVKNDMDANGDDEKEKRTTDNRLNYIMIPLSVTLLITLCLVTCCLQHFKNKRVKTLEAQRREQLKLKEDVIPQPGKVEEQIGRVSEPRRKKRVKRKKKKRMQDEEMRSSDEAAERPSGRINGTAVWFEDEEQPHSRVKAKGNGQQWHKDLEGQDAREAEAEDLRTQQKDAAVDGHLSETKDDIETDDMENDKLQKRKKKKKKKHRKRYTHPADDAGYGRNGQSRTMVLSDSQLGKLPSVRNLPPLKERQSLET